jgi:general L-amino acid transport system permease protein
MTQMTNPPRETFRLSQLIYDRRYRSITIQVVALVAFLAMLSWLVSNTVANLHTLGKDFNFGFLFNRAGYDINQMLIPYTADSTHLRAATVGLLNTLLVAFLGCILATIIGVFVGVLRLSKNWLTSKLMTIYVEGLRNVPVLLWIIMLFAIMTEGTPPPNAFKGENPTASMIFDNTVAITNRGTYAPLPLLGWQLYLVLAVLVVSIVAAILVRRWSVRRLEEKGMEPVSGWLILAIAILPMLLVIWAGSGWMYFVSIILKLGAWAFVLFGATAALNLMVRELKAPAFVSSILKIGGMVLAVLLWGMVLAPALFSRLFPALGIDPTFSSFLPIEYPELKGFNFQGGILIRNPFVALWIALSLYTGAFIAENVRAGVMAISKGQSEAAGALGLRSGRIMSLVVLPQALRIIIPPLISQYLNLTKNTSLGIAVSYMDLRSTLGGITMNQTGREMEAMLLMMAIYLCISLLISMGMNAYNRSVKLKER